MLGEDAGDLAGADAHAPDTAGDDVAADVQVEGSCAPDGAPSGGEHLHAGGVPGREQGHDVAEDAVGKPADEILFLHSCALALALACGHVRRLGAAVAGRRELGNRSIGSEGEELESCVRPRRLAETEGQADSRLSPPTHLPQPSTLLAFFVRDCSWTGGKGTSKFHDGQPGPSSNACSFREMPRGSRATGGRGTGGGTAKRKSSDMAMAILPGQCGRGR